MGMFDDITCDKAILNKAVKSSKNKLAKSLIWDFKSFQTKDLENLMVIYKIDKSGQLFKKHWDQKKFLRDYYTGGVVFYNSFKDDKETEYFVDFAAFFNKGKLKLNKVVISRITPLSTKEERESCELKWESEQEKYDQTWRAKFRKNKFYCKIVFSIYKDINKVASSINRLGTWFFRTF